MMQQKIEPWLKAYAEVQGVTLSPPKKGFVTIPCLTPERHNHGRDTNPSMAVHVGYGTAKCRACGTKMQARALETALGKTVDVKKLRLKRFAFAQFGFSDGSSIDAGDHTKNTVHLPADLNEVRPRFSHEFDYFTPEGECYLKVFRNGTGNRKSFYVLTATEEGGWCFGIQKDTPSYLFNIQHIKPDTAVVVVEGELKARLFQQVLHRRFGEQRAPTVVSWRGGAGSVDQTDWTPLEGKRVILWPDNDRVGQDTMQRICEKLDVSQGAVFSVDVTSLPDKWDVADIIENDGDPIAFLREHSVRIHERAVERVA